MLKTLDNIHADFYTNDFTMKKNGKSFAWASKFFPSQTKKSAENLYLFCRYIDDISDTLPQDESKLIFQRLCGLSNFKSDSYENLEFIHQLLNSGIKSEWINEFILKSYEDSQGLTVIDFKSFFEFCYGVAGVVGLMMSPIIRVNNKAGYYHAIDLGIAMQITNICRDVGEDWGRGKNYLPFSFGQNLLPLSEWTNEHHFFNKKNDYNHSSFKNFTEFQITQLIKLSNILYKSARDGYRYIPWKTRLAIAISARVYKKIGDKILVDPMRIFETRIHTSIDEKILSTFVGVFDFVLSFFNSNKNHKKRLHELIKTKPGAHS